MLFCIQNGIYWKIRFAKNENQPQIMYTILVAKMLKPWDNIAKMSVKTRNSKEMKKALFSLL